MKRCPTCTRVYDGDDLRFCLDDGTLLVDKPLETVAPATLILPAEQNEPTIKAFRPQPPLQPVFEKPLAVGSKRKRNVLIWVVVIALLVPFVAGGVVGAWVLFHKKPLTWHLVLEVDPNASNRSAVVTQTVNVIEKRLDGLGVSNYEVKPDGDPATGRIIINLPRVKDPERLKQIVTTLGKLELVHVISPPSPALVETYATKEEAIASLNSVGGTSANRRALPYMERAESTNMNQSRKWVLVESPAIIDGSDLRDASAVRGAYGDDYEIIFSLNKMGADKFGTWTGAHINEYLGVVLNDEVKSIAFIKSQISDQGVINGRFTEQSAEDLALVLKAGALPAPVRVIEDEGINQ